MRVSCISSQLAFNFTEKKLFYLEKLVILRKLCQLTVHALHSLRFGHAQLGCPWGSLVTSCQCENCPAFVPYLSTTSLSVQEHSLVSHDSTVSLKGFDEGPCQISSGNTNRLYQLELPYPNACCLLQRALAKVLRVAVALKVMTKSYVNFSTKYHIYSCIQ